MRVRQGFVSNSSSSSFVVIGYAFDEDFLEEYENEDEVLDDLHSNFTVLTSGDGDAPPGVIVIGSDMFEIDSETSAIDAIKYSLQDITNKIIEVKKELLDQLDIDEEDLPQPEIYAGVRSC